MLFSGFPARPPFSPPPASFRNRGSVLTIGIGLGVNATIFTSSIRFC